MELRQLRHFLSVLEHGSLTKAAQVLDVSHQALSKSIAALERELKVRLFERGPRGVKPSTFGQALAKHAACINIETRHAVLEMEALRGGNSGHVTIGAGISSATEIVPRIVAGLLKRKQNLNVKILTGTFDELRDQLLSGELDAFVGTVLDSEMTSTLQRRILFIDHDRFVARSKHPLSSRKKVKLADVGQFPWIVSVGAMPFRQAFLDQFQLSGLDPPRVAVESDSLEVTKAMLLEGDYLALLPRSAIQLHLSSDLLSEIDFSYPGWGRTVSLCTRRRGSFAPATRMLLEEIDKMYPPEQSAKLAAKLRSGSDYRGD